MTYRYLSMSGFDCLLLLTLADVALLRESYTGNFILKRRSAL